MERLGIFVLYDKSGIADRYIDYSLKALGELCKEIVLIVNGRIRPSDLRRIEGYITDAYVRNNEGFDAGAYKDALLKFIPYDKWKHYDEVVLLNDTFFGPVFPLLDIWNKVKEDDADFWGITRHPKIVLNNGKLINSHVQSFFLVIRKRMLQSCDFLKYWKNLSYPVDYQSTIDTFELNFTQYFENKGFRSKTITDDIDNSYVGNPYLYNSYQLILENKLPFFKKRCLTFEGQWYDDTLKALDYIGKNSEYDLNLIWENISRLCKEERFESILNYYALEKFYENHKRIFIYGAGKYGKRMQKYFQCREWKFEKFLVSDNINEDKECSNYSGEHFEKTDGIILALGRAATQEVLDEIEHEFEQGQLFVFQFDRG
nr:rhamnan synthesis F family protein [uncultured Schaedlerella sp.]